ncbi:hypothetical protein CHELA1G11_14729 [Hyphomicrobiales bacterium]|nr:hypothetical protein CHELA1G11_14729 [Hyphomicrobiales bacterium]
MIAAIEQFLELLSNPPVGEPDRLPALERALNLLSLIYCDTPEVEPERGDTLEPERRDYMDWRATAQTAFPMLGFYRAAGYGNVTEEPYDAIADAIDDLADIAGDLEKVLWYWRNSQPIEAMWLFRFSFRAHWGAHLQGLRGAVHAALYDA